MSTATKSVTLRPTQPQDEEFLCGLYASTRTEELAVVDWPAHEKEAFLRMQFTAQHTYYHESYAKASYQVILLDGQPVGRLYVQRWDNEIRLIDISLLPEHRNRGIGSSLLSELMAEARGSGRPLTIHVEKFNPALRLYERLGFRRSDDRGVYWFLEWRPDVNEPQNPKEPSKP